MSVLAEILSSRVKAEIFRLLFGVGSRELHLREIERESGLSIGAVRQELQRLSRLELVEARRSGNRLYYHANRDHPLYPEIHQLVLKTAGLADVLREGLAGLAIDVAFVFGSVARSEETAGSDVDLMVIGPVGLRELSKRVPPCAAKIGRAINSHVMTAEEFVRRKMRGEHFLIRVLESPRIYVKGGEDELEGLG